MNQEEQLLIYFLKVLSELKGTIIHCYCAHLLLWILRQASFTKV
jgi:hypothetical protein